MRKLKSIALSGIAGQVVDIEVDIQNGLPQCSIVGLGDTSIQESRERIRSAIKNSGYNFPTKRITINLAPAHLRKSGAGFDLGMALGILLTGSELRYSELGDTVLLGELALDGLLRPMRGALPAVLAAKKLGFKRVLLPLSNLLEVQMISGIQTLGVSSLSEALRYYQGVNIPVERVASSTKLPKNKPGIFFEEIIGQHQAKRALILSAGGGHNLLFEGPPGSGKTMLAQALEPILPTLTETESLEVSQIHSIAGLLGEENPLITIRPFRKIHHTASLVSLVGGGRFGHPGEISLAHTGVLFFDEVLEFQSSALESLRQPLEDFTITITRAHGSYTYPARFLFIGAMNPCPCGYLGDPSHLCTDSEREITKYRARLSGPIWDRLDLFVQVPRVKLVESVEQSAHPDTETQEWTTEEAKKAVDRIRQISIVRQGCTNGEVRGRQAERFSIEPQAKTLLQNAVERMALSLRSYHRVLKVARTIADLESSEAILVKHISEALAYRKR